MDGIDNNDNYFVTLSISTKKDETVPLQGFGQIYSDADKQTHSRIVNLTRSVPNEQNFSSFVILVTPDYLY